MSRAYLGAVRVASVAFLLLGGAILARTLESGGGPLSLGVVTGVALVGIGLARLAVARRLGGER